MVSYKGNFIFSEDTNILGTLILTDSNNRIYAGILSLNNINEQTSFAVEKKCKTDEIIYGTLDNGDIVTLVIHLPRIVSVNFVSTINIHLKSVYINTFLEHNENNDFNFTDLIVNFTNLHRWIDFNTFPSNVNTNGDLRRIRFNEVDLQFTYDKVYSLNDKPSKGHLALYVKIISNNTSTSLEKLIKYVYKIQDFFNLLYHQEILVNS